MSLMVKFLSWVKIIRIQFYPMTWIAYSIGAAVAYTSYKQFNLSSYWLGYVILFLIELCTVLTNDYCDLGTDSINKNASIFTGGSRVLVEGKIKLKSIRKVIFIIIPLIFLMGYFLARTSTGVPLSSILFLLLIGLFLGLGYTIAPLKFCYRGLGELVVGITHSCYVILCGYVFQSGNWKDPLPWLLSIPLFFATFAAITLSGIPDNSADMSVSKKTISVIFGPRNATIISSYCVVIAAAAGILLWYLNIIKGIAGSAIFIVIPHALVLLFTLVRMVKLNRYNKKINLVMALALSYIFWFSLIPLLSLIST